MQHNVPLFCTEFLFSRYYFVSIDRVVLYSINESYKTFEIKNSR